MIHWIWTFVFIALIAVYFYRKKEQKRQSQKDSSAAENSQPKPAMPTARERFQEIQASEKGTDKSDGTADNTKKTDEKGDETAPKKTAMDLCLEFLHKYNCDVSFDEEDDSIIDFNFQGGFFRIEVWNDNVVNILYPDIYRVTLDDYDEISRVRKAINEFNSYQFGTMFYTINKETNSLRVHSRHICNFPGIGVEQSNIMLYSTLSAFFESRFRFFHFLNRATEEEKKQK